MRAYDLWLPVPFNNDHRHLWQNGADMELYAPEYYKEFACIADKCRHSCCIGWEIDIDEDSLERFKTLGGKYGDKVRISISADDDTPHFILKKDGSCPHLDEFGLCKMITHYGGDVLCDICREHPRFYNILPDQCEVGIGASCEAAARLILDSDNYDNIIRVGEYTAPCQEKREKKPLSAVFLREHLYKILKDTSIPYPERLEKLYKTCGISPSVNSDDSWIDVISELEYMDSETKELFSAYSSDTGIAEEESKSLSRFLAYLIYRHASEAETGDAIRHALGFAFFLERLFASLINTNGADKRYELARIISEEIEYSEDNVESIKMEFI